MTKKTSKKVLSLSKAAREKEAEKMVLDLVNASSSVVRSVLEVGSAMASECHELEDLIRKTAEKYNFKREHWYADYKL
tara:strand:+ start:556 stop:789 length:234 start_codon:yes stop_codon:yes gene_type:complete